jgi:periplasmic divalent cation tolerance protein
VSFVESLHARPKPVSSQNKILLTQRSLLPAGSSRTSVVATIKRRIHPALYASPRLAYARQPVTKKNELKVVFVTAPDLTTARRLAKAALKARLVACANLVPKIESHYWWQGNIESSAEVLILFKTTGSKLKALEKLITARHPYDTPEFIALPIAGGNKRYLDWIGASVNPQR